MLDTLSSTEFSTHLGERFEIHWGGPEPMAVTLVSVTPLGLTNSPPSEAPQPPRRGAFSLIFRSPIRDRYLVQRIYTVTHATLGSLDIFLVPIGPDTEGMRYEAVFT